MIYEKHTLDLLLKKLDENSVFVDVGANIGGYAVRIGRYVKTVYAFEPSVRNFSRLKFNVTLNKLDNVLIFDKAVSDRNGATQFFLSKFHGRHSLLGNGESLNVQTITLDSVLSSQVRIDALKIDVEGAELSVLEGAAKVLEKTKFLIVERYDITKSFFVHDYLKNHGFHPLQESDGNVILIHN